MGIMMYNCSWPCYMTIQSGNEGKESQDWTSMLLNMYLGYAKRQGYKTHIEREVKTDNGYDSVTVRFDGDNVFDHLFNERGVHTLVRRAPHDEEERRFTSFAAISISRTDGEFNYGDKNSEARRFRIEDKRIRDLRSGYETDKVEEVLSGDLNDMISTGNTHELRVV